MEISDKLFEKNKPKKFRQKKIFEIIKSINIKH